MGDNGQGKTSLLEAIFAVATLRSFRTAKLADVIAFGRPSAEIAARVRREDLMRVYEMTLAPGTRRVRLDGKAVRPLAKYFGAFNVVVFTPEDLGLPRGAPADRRRFLDRGVFTLAPGYLATASDYEKVLRTRNTVLRQAGQGALGPRQVDELLEVYDAQLARLAVEVIAARRRFLHALGPELGAAFRAITRTGLEANMAYATKLASVGPEVAGAAAESAVAAAVPAVAAQLRASRARDLALQSTQLGPHRDDLVLLLDGREAGAFASQGQLRAIMLAWKTAELVVLARAHGDLPILLLDDVSSELDPTRSEFLFQHLANLAGQCFITTTRHAHVLLARDRADFVIQAGRIIEQ